MKILKGALIATLSAAMFSCAGGNGHDGASGTFESKEIIVSAEGNGRILDFGIEEGETLASAQVVGHIDSLQLRLKRKQLEATRKSVESRRTDATVQLAAIEQQIDTAKSEKNRIENLLKADVANQKQLDDAVAQIAVLEKQLAAQKESIANGNRGIGEEIESLDIQMAQLDDQIAKCSISSPIDGTVLVKYAEEGELATTGKALFKMANLRNMFLRAYVTADQLGRIKLGQAALVYPDLGTTDARRYPGVVSWIADKAEFTPKTIQTADERANLVYAVKVAVKNDGYLKIGMYGKAEFEGN